MLKFMNALKHQQRGTDFTLDEKYGLVPGVKYVFFTKFEKSDESDVRIITVDRKLK